MQRPFSQVDVFAGAAFAGNPVAVVAEADGLSDEELQRIARWIDLSETAFLLPVTGAGADYRVRIFTPVHELPFAGHPTLGACHAWLEAGGAPADADRIVQECGVGLVAIGRLDGRLAFAAPPRTRTGPVDAATVAAVAAACGLAPSAILAAEWVVNGPPWMALLVDSPETVLGVQPSFVDADVGLVAQYPPGAEAAIEVRAFFPKHGAMAEDPATGSLNASLAQWLVETGRVPAPYVASQGTAIGRTARLHVSTDGSGQVWIAGDTVTRITGTIDA